MSTIGSRIKCRREALKLSQDELAKRLGYKSRSSINKIELDQRNLTQSKIKAIADALGTTPDYIMGWEDTAASLPSDATPYDPSKGHRIPILGRIAAGRPIYAEQHIEGYTITDLNGGAEYFALKVKGDSMNAIGINDGYLIIVRRQEEVENGEIAVVMVGDDDATVKRFYATDSTVTLMPQSTNPTHQPQIYDLSKTPVKVLGKVVKVEFSL